MPDPKAVNSMFARIAGRYDAANHLLSGGVDFWWRQRLVRSVHDARPGAVLDLATGSGDVAFALADGLPRGTAITGMDFCQPMLDEAVKKGTANPRWRQIEFRQGDALALPLPDRTDDAVTISFGLRNATSPRDALREIRRVLKPGGRFVCLEFSRPHFWLKPFYDLYSFLVIPRLGAWVARQPAAYHYLIESIRRFPDQREFAALMRDAGFGDVRWRNLSFGIACLHFGTRATSSEVSA